MTKISQKFSADALEDDFDINSVNGSEESDIEIEQDAPSEPSKEDQKESQPKKKIKFDRSLNVAALDLVEQCDFFWTRLRHCFGESSELELEKFKLDEKTFVDNSKFEQPHIIGNFDKYLSFCFSNPGCLKQSSSAKGSPLVLVITASAIRAASVTRSIRPSCGKLHVAKLFAKHIKISEQEKFLSKESITLGCGTPNRMLKLIETDFLKLDRLQLVIFDMFQDPKSRTLFDIPECSKDLFELYRSAISPLITEQNIRIGFF